MFPLGLSTYYWIRIIDGNKSVIIKIKTMIFSSIAFVVAFFRGQRTDIVLIALLPLIYLFYKKRKITILIFSFIWLILLSSIYAIIFKVTTNHLGLTIFDAMQRILIGDMDRNWSYWMAVSNSELMMNRIMDIPFSGYTYTLFTFIPRSFLSIKGYSTETWFVYYMGNNVVYEWGVQSLASINWGITLSGITEGIINAGFIGAIIFSAIVGYMLRIMENLLVKYKYLAASIPLIVILLSGYTFYNIIIIYLPVMITLIILNIRDLNRNTTNTRRV